MPAGVTAQVRLEIEAALTGTNDLGSPKIKLDDILETLELTPGTDAITKADLLFSDTRTLAASASEDLDLAGVLATALGATITAAELVLVFIKAASGNSNNVNVTRPASNGVPLFLAAGDGVGVAPGDFFLFARRTGVAIAAGTGDLLTITNSGAGTPVTYDVVIIGRTVAA